VCESLGDFKRRADAMKRVSAFSEEMWIRHCIGLTRLVRELMKRKLRRTDER